MTRPSDRAIAQAFYEQYQESLRAGIKAHMGFWDGVFAKAKRIEACQLGKKASSDSGAPEGAQPVAWVVGALPNAVHHYNEETAKAEAKRYSLPITALYTAPPSLGGEDGEKP